jgi:urate oxidase
VHRYSSPPADYDAAFAAAKQAIFRAFFGPPDRGVFSPSVQFTLFEMGKAVIAR